MYPTQPPPTDPNFRVRRIAFALLVGATITTALALMALTLGPDGLDAWDWAIIVCFGLTLPWTVIGFWNAAIGLVLMRLPHRGTPWWSRPERIDDGPIQSRIAILSCIRNEDASTTVHNLDAMIADLVALGQGRGFELHVLSDSDQPDCIAAETAAVDDLRRRWSGRMALHYRRRDCNSGYKAGNIREFLLRTGDAFDLALVLDADSLMSADAILRLVRTMEANPGIGILQGLVVGLPSDSAFARAFQFGMRLGMRSYTLGSAWWQGDCGPYWGHNALIRVAPFRDHCELPRVPGRPPLGGWVLSHDQLEAVLMRRAGYEVRVLPVEDRSFEANPGTLPEFIRRDLRWCQGNMQYTRLLGLRGLLPVSRGQLILAILMFLSSPAWVTLMLLGMVRVGLAPGSGGLVDPGFGLTLFALVMTMVLAPKLASLADALMDATARRAFGGAPRLLVSAFAELVFFTLLAPIMAIAHSIFIGGLMLGRGLKWQTQRRASHRVGLVEALTRLWPQTLVGVTGLLWLGSSAGALAFWLSPFFLGALLAVPLAMISASPPLGRALTRIGLWRIPEETAPPAILGKLDLPALTLLGASQVRIPTVGTPVAEPAE